MGGVARQPALVSEAKPFVKWVGGKRQLLEQIRAFVPKRFATYHEPFVGGGAVFFDLRPEKAVISDNNERLVRTYRGIQRDVDGVVRKLREFPHEKRFFLELRERDIDHAESDVEVAAWFIYLNKTGYNGLYRVNSRNGFNVPFGNYAKPAICDEPNLRACADALRGADIRHEPFDAVLGRARRGDFVYFDPPYVPLTKTSNFAAYTAGGFGPDEQRRLRDVAVQLKKRGVKVLLSNSSAPVVRELYAQHFEITEVFAARNVNSNGSGRGRIPEFLIHDRVR